VPSREERMWQHHKAANDMRQIRKQLKRNRKPKRVRQKNWIPDSFEDLDDLCDLPQSERIMPRGESERRRVVLANALSALEEKEDQAAEKEPHADERDAGQPLPAGQNGVVIEISTSLCRVQLDGRSLICGIRGSLSAEETGFTNVIAVGDEVLISENGSDQGVVESVLPRRSILARPDTFQDGYRARDRHRQQIIAANVDQLLIVASWREPHFWPELVDRYLIAAGWNDISPIICVNKIDLAEDVATCRAALQPYLDLGYPVLFTSALTGTGVGKLRQVLQRQTTVLAGLSGVGKSALLTAVQPGLQLRTAEVSEQSREGRHTTTQARMWNLEIGGFVVDTPGIREFGLQGLRRAELVRFYQEIAAVEKNCRFGDCSHTHEPGCAVKAAVRQGRVSSTRYHSYKKIYRRLSE
jgi:ribosome biogenesis GTPase